MHGYGAGVGAESQSVGVELHPTDRPKCAAQGLLDWGEVVALLPVAGEDHVTRLAGGGNFRPVRLERLAAHAVEEAERVADHDPAAGVAQGPPESRHSQDHRWGEPRNAARHLNAPGFERIRPKPILIEESGVEDQHATAGLGQCASCGVLEELVAHASEQPHDDATCAAASRG